MKKVSILMPTYNDAKTITTTLTSVINQTYQNWELIICNDGSNDNTIEVINNFIKEKGEKRIKLISQENKDQLNAIINASNHSSGDYYYILHSDDLFASNDFLEKSINFMKKNKDIDGFYCDLIKIDKNGNEFDKQIVNEYNNDKNTIAMTLLQHGRNMYVDFGFIKKETFFNDYMQNYLIWNGPFWLCTEQNRMLNIKKAPFPSIKYRVFEENYINNDLGRLCVFNGELRVACSILKKYYIPFYKTQYFLFKVFRKINKLNKYKIHYKKTESKNKYKVIKCIISNSFSKSEIKSNILFSSLLGFYKNMDSNKTLSLDHNFIKKIDLYYGKDMRIFNKLLIKNNLSEEYTFLLNSLKKGIATIYIEDNNDYEKIYNICKFLCVNNFVKIKTKK